MVSLVSLIFPGLACTSDPCQNEGTCMEDASVQGKVICTCTSNFGGNICQTWMTGKLIWVNMRLIKGCEWFGMCQVTLLVRELTGVPMHPPPHDLLRVLPFCSGGLSGIIIAMIWDSLLISAIFQNGRRKIWDFQYLGNNFMQDHDFGV